MRNIQNEIAAWERRLESSDRSWDPKVMIEARSGSMNAVNLLVRRLEHRLARIIDLRLAEIRVSDKEEILKETLVQIYHRIMSGGFEWTTEVMFLQFAVLTVTEAIASHLNAEVMRGGPLNSYDMTNAGLEVTDREITKRWKLRQTLEQSPKEHQKSLRRLRKRFESMG